MSSHLFGSVEDQDMAKQLCFDQKALEALLRGAGKAARAVSSTLGPRGRSVLLDRGWGSPNVTKDGATVADDIELVNPFENIGAQMVKEAASKTNDAAGDGTTTSAVLADALFREGILLVTAGVNPIALTRGIKKGVESVVGELKKMSKPIKDSEQIFHIATIAAGNDANVGRMISDAMDKVGRDGVITIEEGKSMTTEFKVVEGMNFDRGFISPQFVTNPEEMRCVLENPYILIYEDKISSAQKLIPLLETLAAMKKPLLIIAEDVEGEALAMLVVNRMKGILQCAAVKAPGYGDRRKAMLDDIAVLTEAKAVFKDLGIDLENVRESHLGRAKRVTITSEDTTIAEGAGSKKAVEERVEQIRREVEQTDSDYDKEKLQERLAKLSKGVAQINIGAATETEMKEKKSRFEDALSATRAAVAEGVLPGGGTALLRARKSLDAVKAEGDEKLGVDVLAVALESCVKQLADNAGVDGAMVLRKVSDGTGSFGYDVDKDKYGDMFEAGIIDATKVTRSALENASSVACLLLTTSALVTEAPEEDEEGACGHGCQGSCGHGH
jgi:chaperonin GroEL